MFLRKIFLKRIEYVLGGFINRTHKLALVPSQKKINAKIYELEMGELLDYRKPITFNQKLNWMKFYWRDPLMTQCSAKDTVRSYIKSSLKGDAEKYLTNLVGDGVYYKVEDIDFEALPSKFVLKMNNASGKNIICSDKSKLDISSLRAELESWMRHSANHYYHKFEWGYKGIVPAILCEEFLGDMGTVRDYKIFCFNGEPRFIYVSNEFDEHKERIDMDYLTLDWSRTGYTRKKYKPPVRPFDRPEFLDEIIEVSRTVSEPFPFVRVDFIAADNNPKLIEMTFYPSGGTGAFENPEHDFEIGKMFDLPNPKNKARFLELVDL